MKAVRVKATKSICTASQFFLPEGDPLKGLDSPEKLFCGILWHFCKTTVG